MNLKPSGMGAEPKKVAILVVCLLIAGYFFYSGSKSDAPPADRVTRRPAADSAPAQAPVASARPDRSRFRIRRAPGENGGNSQQFRPSIKRTAEEAVNPSEIDPTLKLDLLARLQNVPVEGGQRSLFEFAQEPIPLAKEPGKIPIHGRKGGSQVAEAPKPPAGPPQPPPPPPIPLKFYGFVSAAAQSGAKRAFFLDGDDIVVAAEGDVVKKRYKIIRIGINSAVVEDTEHKDQQTLSLVPEEQQQG